MKKVLLIMVVATMLLQSIGLSVSATSDPFAGKSTVNVVYLGGSITAGSGASAPEFKWVNKVGAYLAQTYPDKTFNNQNVGLGGTGSDMGVLRLEQDVISKNPDMVFIEFAVNDNSLADSNAIRYMESIVLRLQQMPTVPYITFIYTTQYNSTTHVLYNKMATHQLVADYYGIPSIDLQTVLASNITDINDTSLVKTFLVDYTHPTDLGYSVYATEIISKLQTGEYYKKPVVKAKKLNPESQVISTKFDMAKNATQVGSWIGADSNLTIKSNVPGDTLSYNFEGPIFAIQHRLSQNGGKYSISIDARTAIIVDTYYLNITSQKVLGYKNFNVGNGKHTAIITILADKNTNSGGTDVAIDNFITSSKTRLNKWVYEDFEKQNLEGIISAGADYSYIDTLADNAGGALAISVKKDVNNVQFGINMQQNVTYKMSARIKMKDTAPLLNEVHFVVQFRELLIDGTTGTDLLYNEPVIKNTNLTPNGWVKVEMSYTFDGKGIKIGTGGQRFNVINDGIAQVRVGDGKLLSTTGSATTPIEYYLDDFIVEPVIASSNTSTNLIKSGDFNTGFDSTSWTKSNVDITPVADGGNGTGSAILVTETGNYGSIKQDIPVKFNRAYKLSFYAKAADTKSQNIYIRGILDKTGRRQDTNLGSVYEYLSGINANDGFVLTDSWKKFEYIYMNDRITFETSIPNFYFRTGVLGSTVAFAAADRPSYYMDEIKFEELEVPYNGSFNTSLTKWGTNTQMSYLATDGANGTLGCAKIAQTSSMSEISQGVDLRPGKKYKISFWGKIDSWANPLTDEKMPITVLLLRNFTPNAADTPPTYTGPTYQYLPFFPVEMGGTNYSNSMFLTSQWAKYELTYDCNLDALGYRTPKMQFRVGNGNRNPVYYLDEIKIEEISTAPTVKTISVSGNTVAGQTLTVNCTYEGANARSGYLYRFLSSSNSVDWVSVENGESTADTFTYKLKTTDANKVLKVEAYAVTSTGELSPISSTLIGNIGESPTSMTPTFVGAWGSNIQGNIAIFNNSQSKPLAMVLVLYDTSGILCGINSQFVTATPYMNDSLSISIPSTSQAVRAKLFVLDDIQNIKPYAASIELLKGGQ